MASSVLGLASMFSPANLLNKNTNASAKAQATPTGSTTSTSSTEGGLTGSTAGSTFLNLLVKELQNQDPTAPMDSTSMVGQMISLNQLDQLISINQVLSTATGSTSSSTTSSTGAVSNPAVSSSTQMAQRAELLNSMQNINASQSTSGTNPNQTLDLSTLNIPYGGK